MFGWFRKDSDSLYSPKQRHIYSYFDGQQTVKADPIAIWKKIKLVGPVLAADIAVGTSTLVKPADAEKAQQEVLKRIREIFQLKPLSEGGLTETETSDLLDHFMTYCEKLKKNTRTIATSATAPSQNIEASKDDSQPMKNTLDSGLIGSVTIKETWPRAHTG